MKLLTTYAIVAWLALMAFNINAVATLGTDPAVLLGAFFDTYKNAWQAQFSTDFILHLLLISGWVVYRGQARPASWLWALAIALLGGTVSLVYVLLAALRSGGNARNLLLGDNA